MDEFDIYTAALELETPAKREKYLDQACRDNEVLREQVEDFLRYKAFTVEARAPPGRPSVARGAAPGDGIAKRNLITTARKNITRTVGRIANPSYRSAVRLRIFHAGVIAVQGRQKVLVDDTYIE